jgi:hypothetical protein
MHPSRAFIFHFHSEMGKGGGGAAKQPAKQPAKDAGGAKGGAKKGGGTRRLATCVSIYT